MLKKMWDKIEKQFFPKKYTDCGRLIGGTKQVDKMELKKLIFKEFKIKDPFANVRKEGIDDIDFNEILNNDPKRVFKIWLALEKDFKNFDKGAG